MSSTDVLKNTTQSSETFLLQKDTVENLEQDMKLRKCWGSNRQLQVDFLAGLFGISAWLSVNALYTQLPILVQTAPEGWSLPSFLSVAIQIANIGPILYSLSQKFSPRFISDSKLIYLVLVIGSLSLILLALYYNVTWVVFGTSGSIVLWVLSFSVALVGCTSSVLFIPFMNHYAEIYLISYMVGEGLGGFFPSIISLIQGVGGNPFCKNTTIAGETVITSYYPPPNFSVETFFYIMFCFMAVSTVAFFLLNNLPSCKRQKLERPLTERSTLENSHSPRIVVYQDPETFVYSEETFSPKTLLILTAVLSAFSNGALPSVQSYSCLPYGNVAYHFAVNLCNMANPAACFIAYFVPHISKKWLCSLVLLSGISIAYVTTTATLSPSPPLQDSTVGVLLIVVSWVACFGSISYVKMSIAGVLRRRGGKGLFQYGAMTQVGAFLGAVISFLLINTFPIFTSYDPCS